MRALPDDADAASHRALRYDGVLMEAESSVWADSCSPSEMRHGR